MSRDLTQHLSTRSLCGESLEICPALPRYSWERFLDQGRQDPICWRANFDPDVCVWRATEHTFPRDLLLYPRRDLAVGVFSPRTRERDLGKKGAEYAIAGTQEYGVIDTDRDTLTRHINADGAFAGGEVVDVGGAVTSGLLPELSFPLAALWNDEARKAWTTALVRG